MSVIKPYFNQRPLHRDLCNHVRTNRWYLLGIQLDIELVRLHDIQVDNESEDKRRSKMFEEWLRVNPEASVGQLIKALKTESVQENSIAYDIEQIYKLRYTDNNNCKDLKLSVIGSPQKATNSIDATKGKYMYTHITAVIIITGVFIVSVLYYTYNSLVLVFILLLVIYYWVIIQHADTLPTSKNRLSIAISSLSSSKVMAVSEEIMKNPNFDNLREEEKFSFLVTISQLETNKLKPLPFLFVDIYEHGKELQPLTCYLTVSVVRKLPKISLTIGRKIYQLRIRALENSEKCQAKIDVCFCEPTTEYNINIKIHSIVNENGEEITGHIDGRDTCSVFTSDPQAYHTAPAQHLTQLEFATPLKGKQYIKLCENLSKQTANPQTITKFARQFIERKGVPCDFKAFTYIYLGCSYQYKKGQPYEKAICAFSHARELSQKAECRNSCLLEGMVYIYTSIVNSNVGDFEEALSNKQKARSSFFSVAACNETAAVHYQEAMLLLYQAKSALTIETKEKMLLNLDMAARHSGKGNDFRSFSHVSIILTKKALIHLNLLQLIKEEAADLKTPELTKEDLVKAKSSLDAVPEEFLENPQSSNYKATYYFTISEYYRLAGNRREAKENMQLAKKQVNWGNFHFQVDLIDDRLLLLSGTQDYSDSDEEWAEILDEY